MRAIGSFNLGYSKGMLSFTLGANAMADISHGTEPRVLGGFFSGRLVRIAKVLRLELAASYSNATYVNMFSGTAGIGVTFAHDAVDLSAYYRRAELVYVSSDELLEQNGVGGLLTLFPTSTVMATVQGETIVGNDVNAIFVIGSLVWRPRF